MQPIPVTWDSPPPHAWRQGLNSCGWPEHHRGGRIPINDGGDSAFLAWNGNAIFVQGALGVGVQVGAVQTGLGESDD